MPDFSNNNKFNRTNSVQLCLRYMNILITGGSGFIGSKLIKKLLFHGHTITNLTTQEKPTEKTHYRNVHWNPSALKSDLDTNEIFDGIIHLAGFSVSNKWNKKNKALMVSSRLESTFFLSDLIQKMSTKPKWFIGASAVGYYADSYEWLNEESEKGSGFLAHLTDEWEKAAHSIENLGIRSSHIRIGIVLSADDGALKKMYPLFKYRIGSAIGTGKQFMSWIHIDDLVNQFIFVAEHDSMHGKINGTAPNPVNNIEFTQTFAAVLGKKQFTPKIPAFLLKMFIGEMSSLVLMSQKCSSKKIENFGFTFQYQTLKTALQAIYGKV